MDVLNNDDLHPFWSEMGVSFQSEIALFPEVSGFVAQDETIQYSNNEMQIERDLNNDGTAKFNNNNLIYPGALPPTFTNGLLISQFHNGSFQPSTSTAEQIEPPFMYTSNNTTFTTGINALDGGAYVPGTTPVKIEPQFPGVSRFEGCYGFSLSFGRETKAAQKSAYHTYSHKLDKWYVQMDTTCPVQYKCNIPPPRGSVIRVMGVFKKLEDVHCVVKKCSLHERDDESKLEHNHLILADMPSSCDVKYDRTESGRENVSVPFEAPQKGDEYSVVRYKFTCRSSCKGGINRRPVLLVFALEASSGELVGRQSVELCICACPGRDRQKEEEKKDKKLKRPNYASSVTAVAPKERKIQQEYFFSFTTKYPENLEKLSSYANDIELAAQARECRR